MDLITTFCVVLGIMGIISLLGVIVIYNALSEINHI